jgi:hypothetical protein
MHLIPRLCSRFAAVNPAFGIQCASPTMKQLDDLGTSVVGTVAWTGMLFLSSATLAAWLLLT